MSNKESKPQVGPKLERPPKIVGAGHVEKPGERRLDDPREALREALSGDK